MQSKFGLKTKQNKSHPVKEVLKTNSATRVPGAPNDLAGQMEPSSNTSLALYESQGFSTRPTRKGGGFASFSQIKSKALSYFQTRKKGLPEAVELVRGEAEHRISETLKPPPRRDKPVGRTKPRVVVAAMVVFSHSRQPLN